MGNLWTTVGRMMFPGRHDGLGDSRHARAACILLPLFLTASWPLAANPTSHPAQARPTTVSDDRINWRSVAEVRTQLGQGREAPNHSESPFIRGYTDHRAWHAWLLSTPSDYRRGAVYWLRNRTSPGASCDAMQWTVGNSVWRQGCEDAKFHLSPIDARRGIDPSYRLGWNSYRSAREADPAEQLDSPPGASGTRSAARDESRQKQSRAIADFPPPKGY